MQNLSSFFTDIVKNIDEILKYFHIDYRIEDMMTVISERLSQSKKLVLNKIFKECQSIPEMITLFLATLELIKVHEVEVEQEENFGDIVLQSVS